MTLSRWRIWLLAARPKTIPLSITPVLAGIWVGLHQLSGHWRWDIALATLLAAMAIQVSTNIWNDAADGERGADTAARLGPLRVTGAGLASAATVRRWAAISAAVAILAGSYLIAFRGWPILFIGVLALCAGFAYSRGPLPLSYTPLGEILVIVFFGVVIVGGTAFLFAGRVDGSCLLFGAALGLPAAAILLVNNHRDRVSDALSGRRTLAILIGETASRWLYGALIVATAVFVPAIYGKGLHQGLATLVLALLALPLGLRMARTPVSQALNAQIPLTAAFQFCALLAAMLAAP